MVDKKGTLLVIEDDEDILESIKIMLEHQNYKVFSLSDGKDVLALAQKEKPNLIIMDVMMPTTNGFEVCRSLKLDEKTQTIPIILLSARTQSQDIETGFKAGADRYLTKPFQNEDLLAAVAALIKK